MAKPIRAAVALAGLPMLLTGIGAGPAPAAQIAGTAAMVAPAATAADTERRSDFNGDGADDLVTAAVVSGTIGSATLMVVRYGGTGQLAYLQAPAASGFSATDFGEVLVTGDFNGDGFDDVANGAPDQSKSGASLSGSVWVVYGSPSGLDETTVQHLHPDVAGIPGDSETNDQFGAALAAGDINNDGRDDLAIGVPGERLGSASRAGMVYVLRGNASGLSVASVQTFHKNTPGIGGVPTTNDRFGHAVALGDVTGNGRADLAIGIPGQGLNGAIVLLAGGPSGVSLTGIDWVTSVPGNQPDPDNMGFSLAIADTTGDGLAEVLSGDPLYLPETRIGATPVAAAGAVICIRGRTTGITETGTRLLTQNSSGVPDTAENNDNLGFSITAGDVTGDGRADVIASVPQESVGSVRGAGALMLFRGSSTLCLTPTGSQIRHQNSSGVPGVAETSNHFGAGLGLLHLDTGNRLDVVTGAWNDTIESSPGDRGRVITIQGSATGFGAAAQVMTAGTLAPPGVDTIYLVGRCFAGRTALDPNAPIL